MHRFLMITAAALAGVAATTIAVASTDAMTAFALSGHPMDSMDMDDDHGHGQSSGTKHGKNARVVKGAREIEVDATSFEFTPNELAVNAGENVAIVLHSEDVLHDFVVKSRGHIVSAKRNKTARGGLRIDKAGTYRFWCSVSGHRAAGMRGTIVVT
jgi:heme/copper-type cytochrome/quinol oxidase subunit 2